MVKFAGKRKTKRKTNYNLQYLRIVLFRYTINTGKALPLAALN